MRKLLTTLLLCGCATTEPAPIPLVDTNWRCEATIFCGPYVDEPDGSDETTICSADLEHALEWSLESSKKTADRICGSPQHAIFQYCDAYFFDVCF